MSNNHIITREIGNLRGFSTDSIFLRPSNVADKAINIQKAPDGTLQIRRGYQCQIADIGGMGIGTFDDPALDEIKTVCVGTDGFVYNKLTKQIFIYYNNTISKSIQGVSNSNPAVIGSIAHGLQPGAIITIRNIITASPSDYILNHQQFIVHSITGPDHFTIYNLNGTPVDSSNPINYPPYVSGGDWTISFTEYRYLTFSIYVDPALIYNGSGQSINSSIIANAAAQVNGNQTLTNTINVFFGHDIVTGNVVRFYNALGVPQQRTVTGFTIYSITVDGSPVSIKGNEYINQYIEVSFGKGFDVNTPYLISQYLAFITDPITGITGLLVSVNGDTNLPAAFLQIVEPIVIDQAIPFIMDYWYWQKVNFTDNAFPPLPGSSKPKFQNSKDFENASMAVFDDVIYICNGWDYPQKYDGQTVYRTGIPLAPRPSVVDDTTGFASVPFATNDVYQYAITYEQVDAKGHIVEGEISEVFSYKVAAGPTASDVTVNNLVSSAGNNWNTDFAIGTAGTAPVYGPDAAGNYYDFVPVTAGFTMKIGDSAYYADLTAATFPAGTQADQFVLNITAGHGVQPGDNVYFLDASTPPVQRQRIAIETSATTMTISGIPVTVSSALPNVLVYKTSLVFADVAIVNGNQTPVGNNILVLVNHNVRVNDIVEFLDTDDNLQRRKVTFVDTTHVTVDGIQVSVADGVLIASINQRPDSITFQRKNANGVTLGTNSPISNNLRINIYRTLKGQSFGVDGKLFLVASIPNDSSGAAQQTYVDGLVGVPGTPPVTELGRDFDNPDRAPNPPPISKYVKCFGTQLFYAGGERGNADNSDRVFFSEGNEPEVVPLASNFFNVPNLDDDITGVGVSGSTFITTKNHSLWAATGNFLSGQVDVVQIASGTNIGCVAHATIASVGTLMYFLHTNGVYAITENQLFPTDAFGNAIPISLAISVIFRETNYLPQNKFVFKRATAVNYTKDNQYLLFLPCEATQNQTTIRDANENSILLSYDYEDKNWFTWNNMNAAGGIFVIDDDLYFQERRFSAVDGNTANLYKQHRFYRLIDHADHAGAQYATWLSSWEDLQQPEVRKKFCRCILLMDRLSSVLQNNQPIMQFYSCLNRLPTLKNTIADITQVNNVRNSGWSISPWGWNFWSGYQDSFITVNLKQGTVAKSIQVGFEIKGINMDIRLAGFQLEAIPENRKTVVR